MSDEVLGRINRFIIANRWEYNFLTGQGTIIEILENDFRSFLNPKGRS